MSLLFITLILIMALAFWLGMTAGALRKEREYQTIIETIFQRKYIVQEKNEMPEAGKVLDYNFMVLKNGKSLKPVFSKHTDNS